MNIATVVENNWDSCKRNDLKRGQEKQASRSSPQWLSQCSSRFDLPRSSKEPSKQHDLPHHSNQSYLRTLMYSERRIVQNIAISRGWARTRELFEIAISPPFLGSNGPSLSSYNSDSIKSCGSLPACITLLW